MGYSPLREDGGLEANAALARLVAHVAPEDRKYVQERIGAAFSGRSPNVEAEYRVVGDDGLVRWITQRRNFGHGAEGAAPAYFCHQSRHDPAGRGREALRAGHGKSRRDPVQHLGRIFRARCRLAVRLLQRPRGNPARIVERKGSRKLVISRCSPRSHDSPVHANFRKVMDERTPLQFETHRAKRWIFYSAYPKRAKAGSRSTFRDISAQKRSRPRSPKRGTWPSAPTTPNRGFSRRPATTSASPCSLWSLLDGVGRAAARRQSQGDAHPRP